MPLDAIRSSNRRTVTSLYKIAQDLKSEDDPTKDIDVLIEKLQLVQTTLFARDEEVLNAVAPEDFEAEDDAIQTYVDKIVQCKVIFGRIKANRGGQLFQSASGIEVVNSAAPVRAIQTSERQDRVKLPKLKIEPFSGKNICHFHKFWNQFEHAVHKSTTMPNIDKFLYLKSYLVSGSPAYRAIDHLEINDMNYNIAVQILRDRFGKEDHIIEQYIAKLQRTSPVRDEHNLSRLRSLHDYIRSIVSALEHLNVSVDQYAFILYSTLIRCVPKPIILAYSRHNNSQLDNDNDSVTSDSSSSSTSHSKTCMSMLKFFENELLTRESVAYVESIHCVDNNLSNHNNLPTHNSVRSTGFQSHRRSTSPPANGYRQSQSRRQAHNIPSAGAFHTSRAPNNHRQAGSNRNPEQTSALDVNLHCIFCNSSHSSFNCFVVELRQREHIIRQQNRCFRCLKQGHISRRCNSRPQCTRCQGVHLTVFHDDARVRPLSSQNNDSDTSANASQSNAALVTNGASSSSGPQKVILQTAQTIAFDSSGHNSRKVRLMFDSGSSQSYISRRATQDMNLSSDIIEKWNISTFGQSQPLEKECRRVHVNFACMDGTIIGAELLELDDLCCSVSTMLNEPVIQLMQAKGIVLSDSNLVSSENMTDDIDVLIGCDLYPRLTTDTRIFVNTDLIAINTKFGWTLLGSTTCTSNNSSRLMTMKAVASEVADTGPDFERLWSLDHIGIADYDQSLNYSSDQQRALDLFDRDVKWQEGRYHVRLPFKNDNVQLNDNYTIAQQRLHVLLRKLRAAGSDSVQRYDRAINDYVDNDHAERVSSTDNYSQDSTLVYYMPHRSVIREDKSTTKFRVVFDCSSHINGATSLNDNLLAGPNLNPDLIALLLSFRQFRYAFTADIEKAFLQIRIHFDHRDALRFLWIDMETQSEITYRMKSLPFGTASSPFLLAAVIRKHISQECVDNPRLKNILDRQLYVDDLVYGADSRLEAQHIYSESIRVMKSGGFHLRKWASNDRELHDYFRKKQVSNESSGESEQKMFKVFGLGWNRESDTLFIDAENAIQFGLSAENTKRMVLRASSRLYDPLGLLNPFVIRIRVFFQQLWKSGINWDSTLDNDHVVIWREWLQELPYLRNIAMPRWAICEESCNLQLHVFCDASPLAYAVAFYLRSESSSGNVTCTLLMSKTRVAPIKTLTLPRLELMGAVIGARLYRYYIKNVELDISQLYFWTDSNIALNWIKGNPGQWKPFVANRVEEIQKLVGPSCWHHCPGICNPADLSTRGISVHDLTVSQLWWEGPTWLKLSSNHWPKSGNTSTDLDSEITDELRKSATTASTSIVPSTTVFDFERFGSYRKLVNTATLIYRWKSHSTTEPVTAEQRHYGEIYVLRQIQISTFQNDISLLKTGKQLPVSSKLRDFKPFLDSDGLLRIGGRLQNSVFSDDVKHPIILPPDCHATRLLVMAEHKRILHGGVSSVLAALRERYWIIRSRQVVKSVLSRCVVCRRLLGAFGNEQTAPLPADRVTQCQPFEVIGFDFAGPLMVKSQQSEHQSKAYVALFTCAVTRAIHLELVCGLDAHHVLQAMRRFAARRGLPRVIYSDNALAFSRANKELHDVWKSLHDPAVVSYFAEHKITWKFIIPRASWFGGFYERLVRSVKISLKKTLGNSNCTFEQLQTVLCEVEAVINDRPLAAMSNSPDDGQALTPSFCLIGKRLTALPSVNIKCEAPPSKGSTLRKLATRRQQLMKSFWKRWESEYLLQLVSAHKSGNMNRNPISLGDVVLLQDDNKPRLMWRYGVVTERHFGRDGGVRSYSIRLSNGNTLKRPAKLIVPLEVVDKP